MPPEIRKLTEKFLKNPVEISVAPPATTAETIEQKIMLVSAAHKKNALKSILDRETVKNAFVFCNRKRDVDLLGRWLKDKGFKAASLHGDMVQSKRTETLNGFKAGEIILLVCSDVAARGLDVSGVSHVFNYDVPFNPDDYVHRIGRTGRAGQLGVTWMLATDDDEKLVSAIEARIGRSINTEPYIQHSKSDSKPVPQTATRPAPKKQPPQKQSQAINQDPKDFDRPSPQNSPKNIPKNVHRPHSNKPKNNDEVIGFGDDIPAFLRRT
jgi:superfamily II DNA/RNA helicase